MKINKKISLRSLFLVFLVTATASASIVAAQSGGDYLGPIQSYPSPPPPPSSFPLGQYSPPPTPVPSYVAPSLSPPTPLPEPRYIPPPPPGPPPNVAPPPPSAPRYIYTPPQSSRPIPPPPAPPDYRMRYPWFFSPPTPAPDPPTKIPADLAVAAVSKPRLTTEERKEGILMPFVINNRTDKEYGADIELICSDFEWQKHFLFKKGLTRTSLFGALQDSAAGRYDEAQRFVRGEKAENCSLLIAHVSDDDFSDDAGPADADISNNAFRFTLLRRDQKLIISSLQREKNNIKEKTRTFVAPLAEEERQVYRDLAQEKCLNILIASSDRGTYYNGELLDEKPDEFGPWIKLQSAHIAGDRLGYVDGTSVYVDDEYVGEINEVDKTFWAGDSDLYLNEKHYAYPRKTDFDKKNYLPTYRLIYDGKDLGETGTMGIKLNGDYVIYPSSTFTINRLGGHENVKFYINVNGKQLAEGVFADYDGKNLIMHDSKHDFVLNGKRLGFGGNGVIKDGHVAYILGKTENVIDSHVFLDGKDLGPGRQPVIERDHIAFLRAPSELDKNSTDIYPNAIYDGHMLGKVSGAAWKIDLEGDHIAYVRRLDKSEEPVEHSKDFDRITIDGKDYPGDFFSGTVRVEIEERQDRSSCK